MILTLFHKFCIKLLPINTPPIIEKLKQIREKTIKCNIFSLKAYHLWEILIWNSNEILNLVKVLQTTKRNSNCNLLTDI